ncbi:MAG: hypothetical protein HZA77_05420 [Candidatus Schekmanbacteria bacterium]|nr:hypothetical protein [Candidatus Schekmanbacteria bacterium]
MLRTIVAGLAGGLALNVAMLLTFRLIGFGWNGGGILLDPSIQNEKLIAVWTKIRPLPLVVSNPAPVVFGFILFGIGHAFIYRWLSNAWPSGVAARGVRFAALLLFLSFFFWEFFTPFNQFGEPLLLIGLELIFWTIIAVAEAFTIASIIELGTKK